MPKTSEHRHLKDKAPGTADAANIRVVEPEVQTALDLLKSHSTRAAFDALARYAIPSDRAFGVAMRDVQSVAKRLGRDHKLAAKLWATGWYEARLLASYVDDPACVTSTQMDRWCREFDNWAVCDTVCYALFDRTPHAWGRVEKWSGRNEEFIKRAAFALLWGLTVHDKEADDDRFVQGLSFIERAATDERHFVKKAVNMALRAIGKRNPSLNVEASAAAKRLAASPDAVARWVGKDALRELDSPALAQRLARKHRNAV